MAIIRQRVCRLSNRSAKSIRFKNKTNTTLTWLLWAISKLELPFDWCVDAIIITENKH